MTDKPDMISRGATARRLGPDFRWPDGRRVAVVFNVAFESWSDGKPPGIGPMGNPLPAGAFDTNALSWGSYGVERGITNMLDVLKRTKTKASIMTSGVFAERAPQSVKRIADEGHEIVPHCWAQDVIPATLTTEQVRADIEKTTQALAQVSGIKPRGWISPRGTPHADSARFLVEAGYTWQGDVFDDDKPYVQNFEGGKSLTAIPLTMEINDLPHAMRYGRSPRQFIELFDDYVGAVTRGGHHTIMVDVTAHTHVYGRVSGAWAYEAIAEKAAKMGEVWVATRAEIDDYVRKTAR